MCTTSAGLTHQNNVQNNKNDDEQRIWISSNQLVAINKTKQVVNWKYSRISDKMINFRTPERRIGY